MHFQRSIFKQNFVVKHFCLSFSQPNTVFKDTLTFHTVNTHFNFATGLSLALAITART